MADNKYLQGYDPVTVADRAAEEAMRAILAERRPEDAILGEEFGSRSGTSGLTWVLDPIDGTRGFISGTPTWGVLIALSDASGPIFGMIDQPYIGERFIGGRGPRTLLPRQTLPNARAPHAGTKQAKLTEMVCAEGPRLQDHRLIRRAKRRYEASAADLRHCCSAETLTRGNGTTAREHLWLPGSLQDYGDVETVAAVRHPVRTRHRNHDCRHTARAVLCRNRATWIPEHPCR